MLFPLSLSSMLKVPSTATHDPHNSPSPTLALSLGLTRVILLAKNNGIASEIKTGTFER